MAFAQSPICSGGEVVGKCGVVCAACQNPCLRTSVEIRLRCPVIRCYRKLRHRLLCLLTVHIVDDETETVAEIDQGCCDTASFLGGKYQSRRVFSVPMESGWH